MDYSRLLPIGSVVKIKDVDPLYMVFGVLQKPPAQEEIVFDYVAVKYPEGYLNPMLNLGFNHEEIEEVVFRGYEDANGLREEYLMLLRLAGEEARKNGLDLFGRPLPGAPGGAPPEEA